MAQYSSALCNVTSHRKLISWHNLKQYDKNTVKCTLTFLCQITPFRSAWSCHEKNQNWRYTSAAKNSTYIRAQTLGQSYGIWSLEICLRIQNTGDNPFYRWFEHWSHFRWILYCNLCRLLSSFYWKNLVGVIDWNVSSIKYEFSIHFFYETLFSRTSILGNEFHTKYFTEFVVLLAHS